MLTLDCRNHVNPIFRRGAQSSTIAPRPLEDRVQEQHCHVTANAIALLGNARYGFNHRSSETRLKGVQLENVWPRGKIGILTTRINRPTQPEVRRWVVLCILSITSDEILWMFRNPGMIRCYMVGHEVQNQFHPPHRELVPGNCKTVRASQMHVDNITFH